VEHLGQYTHVPRKISIPQSVLLKFYRQAWSRFGSNFLYRAAQRRLHLSASAQLLAAILDCSIGRCQMRNLKIENGGTKDVSLSEEGRELTADELAAVAGGP
jgi:hypothetical protein